MMGKNIGSWLSSHPSFYLTEPTSTANAISAMPPAATKPTIMGKSFIAIDGDMSSMFLNTDMATGARQAPYPAGVSLARFSTNEAVTWNLSGDLLTVSSRSIRLPITLKAWRRAEPWLGLLCQVDRWLNLGCFNALLYAAPCCAQNKPKTRHNSTR